MSRDLIQYTEINLKWIVFKIPTNVIKKGTELLVRPGQVAVTLHDGQVADIYSPGKYELNEKSMPRFTALGGAFHTLKRTTRVDIYFVNTTLFINNGWGTKDPIIRKDPQMDIVRLRAFGTFSFQISDPVVFINMVFGTRLIGTETSETINYLSNTISETIAIALGQIPYSILDMAPHYSGIAGILKRDSSNRIQEIGITLTDVQVEHIGTVDTVNDMIDDYSGMQLAKKDFDTFERYQTIRSMREAASKPGTATVVEVGRELGHTIGKIVDKD